MTTEQLKNWLKTKIDVGEGIRIGSIDGNASRFIGVYRKEVSGGARISLLENAGRLGVPLPRKLLDALEQVKAKNE